MFETRFPRCELLMCVCANVDRKGGKETSRRLFILQLLVPDEDVNAAEHQDNFSIRAQAVTDVITVVRAPPCGRVVYLQAYLHL